MVEETTFIFVASAVFFVTAKIAAASWLVTATIRRSIIFVIIGVAVLAGVAMAVIMLATQRALLVTPIVAVAATVAVIAVIVLGKAIPGIADPVAPALYLVAGAGSPVFHAVAGAVHPGIVAIRAAVAIVIRRSVIIRSEVARRITV